MLLGGSRIVTAVFASILWANKSRASFPSKVSSFITADFRHFLDWRMLMELVG